MSGWHGLGPALPRPALAEAVKAAMGAGFGLVLAALVLAALNPAAGDPRLHPLLIAPFGASAFLIFVVPSSPLAQPWSVVVGNTVSALAALAVLCLPLEAGHAAALAVLVAVLCMGLVRALHPPGGAVALFAALAHPESWSFALTPVFAGSVALVLAGMMWNRITRRVYPARQPAAGPHGTRDPLPERRHLPPPGALADLLAQLRLGANIGVEDLTRLITAAEAEAALRPLAGLTADNLMSRDLVTVRPDTPLADLSAMFRQHRFKTLPITDAAGRYLGLVAEAALLGQTDPALSATGLAAAGITTFPPEEPAAHLVQCLADGGQEAVPIVQGDLLVGLVTRSDLLALLARPLARA